MKCQNVLLSLLLLFCLSSVLSPAAADVPRSPLCRSTTGEITPCPVKETTLDARQEQALRASFSRLPLAFVKNEGQKDPAVLYYEQGSGHATAFTREGITLSLARSGKVREQTLADVVTLTPLTPSSFTVESLDPRQGTVNYLTGNDPALWKTQIPTYGAILYKGIYPGIDMKFYGTNSQIEYDIIIAPHADPHQVRLSYTGIDHLALTPDGELEIILKEGSIFQKKPFIYQTTDGTKTEIPGRFVLLDTTTYTFEVGPYDTDQPLIIDPTLVYSTYLGGGGLNEAHAIAIDSSGNAYVAGITGSTDFPTENAYQGANAGQGDAFITKFDPSGTSLVYSTYLGGSGLDLAKAIAVDASGNAYVVGHTGSTDFPAQNPYQVSYGGGQYDAFVTKLDPSGTSLIYSTYLGGSDYDGVTAIAVDSSGNAYVAGWTNSANFPTMNPYQDALRGGDAFVTKLSPTGSLVYSTYLGGSDYDEAQAIAVDASGNAYVAGYTYSTDFPTQNAYQAGGAYDAFITKFDPSGTSLVYSTYLGGSGLDWVQAIAVDASGNAYVAGYTGSTDFPTRNAFQESYGGGEWDAFITKLDPSGTSLVYSTYLGGTGGDVAYGLAVDSSGNAYVAGWTYSADFPTRNACQGSYGGGYDTFVTKLNTSGTALVYSTYLGGSWNDQAYALAVDSSGNAYVAGVTESPDFPIQNAYQGSLRVRDAFITRLSDAAPVAEFITQQYRDFLNRDPDEQGLSAWVGVLTSGQMTRAQVVESFLTSSEFGGVIAPLVRLYFAYFLRVPDYEGLLYWIGQRQVGLPLNDISSAFASSQEFIDTYGSLSPDAFITLVYHNVLGRDPDPSGFSYWLDELTSNRMTRGQIMAGFSESPEYQALMGHEVLSTMMYVGLLRRSPEPGGFTAWVGYLDAGNPATAMIDGFLTSAEYRGRF